MYFYKELLEDYSVRYCETTLKRTEPNFEEISQAEYMSIMEKLFEDCFDSPPIEVSPDEISPEEFMQLIEEAL